MRLYEITTESLHMRIFEFLRGNHLVKTKGGFSTTYLGCSRSYVNTLISVGIEPSRKGYAVLQARLEGLLKQDLKVGTKRAIRTFIAEIDQRLETR